MSCTTSDAFIALGTILGGVGALIAGLAARRALDTWRTQLKAQTRFESAKRLMIAAHELAQAFHAARNPFVLGGERPAKYAAKNDDEMTSDERADSQRQVFKARWEPVRLSGAKISGLLPEVRALLPLEIAKAADDLLMPAWKLRISMDDYVELVRTETGPGSAPSAQVNTEWKRLRSDVFGQEPKPGVEIDNRLTIEFARCHEHLVRTLQPYVEMVDTNPARARPSFMRRLREK